MGGKMWRKQMDKIKEEFEKYFDDPYFRLESDFPTFEAGYKSRNPEIKRLKEDFEKQAEEIEKLNAFEKIDKQRIEEGLAEIEKLNIAVNKYKQMYVAKLKENKKLRGVLDKAHTLLCVHSAIPEKKDFYELMDILNNARIKDLEEIDA